MTRRVIVSLHLPLDMGSVGRILKAIAREYPDATVGENMTVIADDGEPAAVPRDFGEQIISEGGLPRDLRRRIEGIR